MEKIEHKNKIQRLLRKSWGYNLQESVNILNECQSILQEEIDIKVAKEKEKEDAIIERILNRKRFAEERKEKIEERKRRIRGYKITRFKKPLPALEDRNQYVRCCKKCGKYYRTFAKYGMVCDKCKTSGVSDGVPKDLHTNKYIEKQNGKIKTSTN